MISLWGQECRRQRIPRESNENQSPLARKVHFSTQIPPPTQSPGVYTGIWAEKSYVKKPNRRVVTEEGNRKQLIKFSFDKG